MAQSACVNWLFGRGLSISCNLTWAVPGDWRTLRREDQIGRIEKALPKEMAAAHVDTSVIRRFLDTISSRTNSAWRHRFVTTNWDYLLQREVLRLGLTEVPSWMDNSHVFHINGTVEVLKDNSQRSAFVLEDDPSSARVSTTEANVAWNKMLWDRLFVVIGMSFECEVDKFLLTALSRVEDEMPIGESTWIVLNPAQRALGATCERVQRKLPRAKVVRVLSTFAAWLESGMRELDGAGVLKTKG